jgi:type II secretory ATPase GspE/PulE/Tfp pilus assembly ATPase PilB-like protein
LQIDKEMEQMILEKKPEQEIFVKARAKSMITLREDALLKSMQGVIPFSESMGL